MSHITDKPVCHRADDMISFMYGEVENTEASDFPRHLETCALCRSELALLSSARDSMSQWRSAVLGATWQAEAAAETNSPHLPERKPVRRLSALAALREFFAVSPLWLRGATAMAAIMFCLLVGLLGARMLRTPQQLFTQDEVNAQVQRQVDQLKREGQLTIASETGAREEVVPVGQPSQVEPASFPAKTVRRRTTGKSSRRFLTKEEREQLAADLRLQPTTDEDDFSSLLDGGSN
jgi:anti-sigma factor RsiW